MYNLFKGNDKVDVLTFIGKRGVEGLGMELQGCEVGKELNRRMNETHRIMKAI